MAKRILIADDSVTIQKAFVMTFAGADDVTLTSARSADEGLAIAQKAHPDLIIADGTMPGRSGYDLCAAVRADPTLRAVPVLILASTQQPYDEGRGQKAGANGHLLKPWETNAIIEKVRTALLGGDAPVASPVSTAPVAVAGTVGSPRVTAASLPTSAIEDDEYGEISVDGERDAEDASDRVATPPPAAGRPRVPTPPPAMDVRARIPTPPPPPGRLSSPGMPAISPTPPAPGVSYAPHVTPSSPALRPSLIPGLRPGSMPPARPGTIPVRPTGGPAPAPAAAPPRPVAPPVGRTMIGLPAANVPIPGVMRPGAPAPVAPAPPSRAPSGPVSPLAPARPPSGPVAPLAPRVSASAPPGAQMSAAIAGGVDQRLAAFAAKGPEYEAIAKLSREIIEQIVWEVVPELAEAIIREQVAKRV